MIRTKKLLAIVLCLVILSVFGVSALASTQTVNPTASTVIVDGTATAFEAYLIGGNNFFKLRDLAYSLNGSSKQFAVGWDSAANAISLTSGEPYEPSGGEMTQGDGVPKAANLTTSRVYLDNRELSLTAYNIGGNNFFRLRDLMRELDIGVTWDGATSTIGIDTSIGYVEDTPIPSPTPAPSPSPTPTPTPPSQDARSFSGTGDTVVRDINLPAGNYYVRSSHEGSSNFIAYFYYGEGDSDRSLVANTIGRSSGERLFGDTLGIAVSAGILEVRADGNWKIEILEVAGTITSPISGNGDTVTGLISGFSGRRTITVTHNGSSNIIVYLYTYDGGNRARQLVGNDIGISSGERTASFSSSEKYFFSVTADGDWTITIS